MNEILDAVSSRLKSPYFGYSLLAFAALNWRGIFLLTATAGTPETRLAAFDAETSVATLIMLPLIVGAIVAASTPWIRFAFSFISRRPFELIDNVHLESEHKKTIRKTELERSRTAFFADKENELIERAKRDEQVQGIEDDQLKERLMSQLESLREDRDRLSETLNSQSRAKDLTMPEMELLKAAAKSSDGSILRNRYLTNSNIQAGNTAFGETSAREFAKYDSALASLDSKGLVQGVGKKGEIFHLTQIGWQIAESL